MEHEPIPSGDEEIGRSVIGAAIEVHRVLGPGFLESVYQKALVHELKLRGLKVATQKKIVIVYKGISIEGQRLDLLVGDRVIVELKAIDTLAPIHQAKVISYLKATQTFCALALLMNFNVTVLKSGLKRIVR